MLRDNISSSSSKSSNNGHLNSSNNSVVVAQSAASANDNNVLPSSTSGLLNGNNIKNKIIGTKGDTTNSTVVTSLKFREEEEQMIRVFDSWSEVEQTTFVESLLSKMSHCQHSQINSFLKPMLQRDFISLLPSMLLLTYPLSRNKLFN